MIVKNNEAMIPVPLCISTNLQIKVEGVIVVNSSTIPKDSGYCWKEFLYDIFWAIDGLCGRLVVSEIVWTS